MPPTDNWVERTARQSRMKASREWSSIPQSGVYTVALQAFKEAMAVQWPYGLR